MFSSVRVGLGVPLSRHGAKWTSVTTVTKITRRYRVWIPYLLQGKNFGEGGPVPNGTVTRYNRFEQEAWSAEVSIARRHAKFID